MPQATLKLQGSYSNTPPSFPASAQQMIGSPIDQTNYVKYWAGNQFDLTSDASTPLTFPPAMTQCHFLYINVQGGSAVQLILTSADGTSQAVPCDPLTIMYMTSVPVTAISLVRTAGVATTITYLIAQNQ